MPTVEINSKTYIDSRQRLRIIWNCELKVLGGSARIHLYGYFNQEDLTEERDDYWEILARYKTDRDRFVESRIFQSLDMVSVLRSVVEDMGLNPDNVTYKLMPAKEEENDESKMDTLESETEKDEYGNPKVY